MLTDTAALLDSLVDQTLAGMEAGLSLNAVLQSVKLPVDLLQVRSRHACMSTQGFAH